ncbi:MAG: hypothetical protein CBD16_09720 [Betaproteobacteria bacterium TMED156]|nr:MAG: hypothetical protein CBD16_09720 [Betaproteobacteria bacterium TMED156]|tara:strand:- start:972 stop:1583 length:612 start_codon:yes stop_codon:yes gene_type:complete
MRFETTTKLFYSKFPYKAIIEHRGFNSDDYYDSMTTMLRWLKKLSKDDYQMRHARSIQLFFKKRKDLEYVMNNYSKWVTEIHEPFNKKHYEHLKETKDCITRNRLFWNKYKYKITFSCHSDLSKIIHWFGHFFTDKDTDRYRYGSSLHKMIREKDQWKTYWCNPVLYLTNHDDVMLCKLALDNHIMKIETAITFDEFKGVSNG